MNYQVDIIIIGDSREGRETLKKLALPNPTIKIAYISRDFKKSTTRDYLNVEYVQREVTYVDYRNRLFGCYLKNGDRFYCTHLIIASGLKYEPFKVGSKEVPDVYNTLENLPKYSKDLPAVVIGQDNNDAKFALLVAKKFKHVYFCTEQFSIEGITPTNLKKLDKTENLILLPNSIVSKVNISNGTLKSVELNNYSVITCSAIFIKTKTSPETFFISNKLIVKNDLGYLETNDNAESTIVPKCFAIGSCCKKSTKRAQLQMIENIQKDFKEV